MNLAIGVTIVAIIYMTKLQSSDKHEKDRPVLDFEMEITPEMTEAGVLSLECSECADLEDQATRVFRAMALASPAFRQFLHHLGQSQS